MKKKEERMEKQMNEIMAENKRLTEPLQKAREEVEELRRQVCHLLLTLPHFAPSPHPAQFRLSHFENTIRCTY